MRTANFLQNLNVFLMIKTSTFAKLFLLSLPLLSILQITRLELINHINEILS